MAFLTRLFILTGFICVNSLSFSQSSERVSSDQSAADSVVYMLKKAILSNKEDVIISVVDKDAISQRRVLANFSEYESAVSLLSRIPDDYVLTEDTKLFNFSSIQDMIVVSKELSAERMVIQVQGTYLLKGAAKKPELRPFIIYLHLVEGQWKVF